LGPSDAETEPGIYRAGYINISNFDILARISATGPKPKRHVERQVPRSSASQCSAALEV
jgi:hypothetical protein